MANKTLFSNLKGQRVFLTGVAGFIGSHLLDKLISLGAEVTGYDNLSSGKKEFIAHHFGKESFRFVKGDILDYKKLNKYIRGHEIVFHLAANPNISYGTKHPDWDLKQETIATYNILEAMRLNKIKKIVFSSTSAVFGRAKIFPTSEDYGPLLPTSLYGANKLACEGLISAYVNTFGFQAWIFRFANIIGKRATHGVLLDFINQLEKHPRKLTMLSNGSPKKNFMLVEECIEAIIYILLRESNNINLFNLASFGQTTVGEIAEIIIQEMSKKNVHIKKGINEEGWPGDVVEMELDTTKLNKRDFRTKYNSTESVKIAVKKILCKD